MTHSLVLVDRDGHKLEIKILYVIFRFMPNLFESDGCTGAEQAGIVMVSKRLPEIIMVVGFKHQVPPFIRSYTV